MKSESAIVQVKMFEQYVPMALFVMRFKLVLNMKSEDETLKCGRSLPKSMENDSNDSNFCGCE